MGPTGRSRGALAVTAALASLAACAPAAHAGSKSYPAPGTYLYTVPATVTSLDVTAVGGNGKNAVSPCAGGVGGRGRIVTQTLAVTPGEVLQISVGGAGSNPGTFAPGGGGFNGGGRSFTCTSGGGGASDVRRAPFGAADRVVVAGGGGGAGSGAAGGDAGSNGSPSGGATPGNPGTAGAAGVGGAGGPPSNACCSGGTNGTTTNGGDAGSGNSSGGGGGGGYGGGGGGSGGLNTGANGGGGGGGGGSLGTPTGFNANVSGVGSVTVTHTATTVEIVKVVSPTSDSGRFDLKVNGATAKADATNGDSTGQVVVSDAPTTTLVGEAGGTATNVSNYDSAIACDNGASGAGPTRSIAVTGGASVICTITNTRLTGTISVVNHLDPATDPGRFDLLIGGVTKREGAGDGDGTGPVTVDAGTVMVGESAVLPASAADYTTTITCRNGGGAGAVVASASNATSLVVPVAGSENVVCSATNTLTPTLTVVHRLEPASDPGRFDLQIDGVTRRAGAGDGDSTGALKVNAGTRTVGATAVEPTDAADYTTTIDCRSGDAVVASSANAGPLDVPTGAGQNIVCTITDTRKPIPPPLADDDGDGVPNAVDNCGGVANPAQRDTDGFGLGDACDPDDDQDGLSDKLEARLGTSPRDQDTDDDGLTDRREDMNADGRRNARETDPRKRDTDGDGIQDGTESGRTKPVIPKKAPGTNRRRFRPDLDPTTRTNPRNRDTDGDGIADGREDANRNGRVDRGETDPLGRS